MLSDVEFQTQFENLSLPKEEFNHMGHLRLAWIYLRQYSFIEAVDKTCSGINQYAISLGAAEKFHRTITEATLKIVQYRLQQNSNLSFLQFVEKNADISKDLMGVLLSHYSVKRLNSETAKRQFIEPDISTLDTI